MSLPTPEEVARKCVGRTASMVPFDEGAWLQDRIAAAIRADRLRVLDEVLRTVDRVRLIRGCDCRGALRDLRREIEQS